MKNIVYFHGLSSSGNSGTGKTLKSLFKEENIITPDIPVYPDEALPYLKNLISSLDPENTIIVGTSMGGMFVQQMSGYKRILVNPAFHVSETLKKNKGLKLPFFSERKDGISEFEVTDELIKQFEEMESHQFEEIDNPDNVIALFGTQDLIVDCKAEFLNYYKNYLDFEGEHRLSKENIKDIVAPLIKKHLYS